MTHSFPTRRSSDLKVALAATGLRGKVTTLINNAGIVNRSGITGTAPERWNRILAVNLTGPFLGMQAIAPLIRDAGGGALVNLSSIAAFVGHNDPANGRATCRARVFPYG